MTGSIGSRCWAPVEIYPDGCALGLSTARPWKMRRAVVWGRWRRGLERKCLAGTNSTSFSDTKVSDEALQSVLDTTRYQKADVTSADRRSPIDLCPSPPALYFALPPSVTVAVCKALQQVSLPEGTNLVLEKPSATTRRAPPA